MIRVYLDREALSLAAAELFATAAQSAVLDMGRFAVALAGGDTPRRTYEILAHEPFRNRVPWEKTHVFWGDERCVPAADPRNNARMAGRALLDHVPIPDGQVHPMVCGQAPQDTAKEYEALLRSYFPGDLPYFDLILLGLGENGHTASLFPQTPVLDERRRWVADVLLADEGMCRLSLTVPVINQASRVVFLVSGVNKASILREVLEGSPDPHRVPASLIRPAGQLVWLVDRDAARLLRNAA
ncbi:6-phosphogluconolactonase [Geobacter hydrogenophilus]|uniref:6-phosphogluconolactonase n=1 Tax=Geobacter hydrogenophilus TaxID=40983 RepID=A0A9W6G3Y2_9BACT|nr:6-phosphogluconolactonase [Geobacter hydrogenophilus]MBT0892558.1 6-phosphogluconolactonase [Geobacter hydrogenophilus]GLI39955.1 6-phosphogluconolactonase [Geobacter hydrogenophilus]